MLQLNSDNYYNLKKSLYFEQFYNNTFFVKSESWIVLLPIEQQIKDKIELIGTPLKEWNISINYGIKTGFNEAFIINGDKRRELIDLDSKSDEIIRPLLRGRDIKRYSYDFADLYIITTFPSLKIEIEQYPAIKEHLMGFGYDRLKQTGEKNSRKKTNNKWFEIQDSISYWEDFYKQKIVWKIIGDQMAFSIDSDNFIVNNACYILTGKDLEYLVAILNSKIIKWYSYLTNMNKTGVGDMQVGAQNVVLFPVPILSEYEKKPFNTIVDEILKNKKSGKNMENLEHEVNKLVYNLYGITKEEVGFIEFQ